MNAETVLDFIQKHEGTCARLDKLERYYKGDNDILKRTMTELPDYVDQRIKREFS